MSRVVKIVQTLEMEVPGLGERIKAIRKADSRSLGAIAAAAGMSAQNWYRIEDERQALSLDVLRSMEKALNVSLGVPDPLDVHSGEVIDEI